MSAIMTCWNNVSLVYPYVDDLRFDVDEGNASVGVVRYVDSLRILAVSLSSRGSS